jgi:ABC-2 type transport system permease protein
MTMKRFLILLRTEIKALLRDPLPMLGGLIPPTILLVAFGLLFGGRLSFTIAVLNHDAGPWGDVLRATFDEVISPFGQPYYAVLDLPDDQAWQAYHEYRLDGVWVIPEDFSARLEAGRHPTIEMYFSNYNDDRAKNHRIYSAEIMWRFYEKAGLPGPPLDMAEEYPLPEMVDWFSLIGVGLVLLAATLGGMFNVFILTYKEQVAKITLEFGMSPRPMVAVLLPKVILALVMGLLTGTVLMGFLALWTGIWPGRLVWVVWLLCGLAALFWIALMLILSLRARHFMAGAIGTILGGITVFFVSGGLGPVQYYPRGVLWFARLFPNTHVVDPLRDLILFHAWPGNWLQVLLIAAMFAAAGLVVGFAVTGRRLRRIG